MNFKKFNDIGDCEPRAWNKNVSGTKFSIDDDDDDEIPVPYCDDFDEDSEEEVDEEEVDETETETETDSVTSSGKPVKRGFVSVVLQEESDFMAE
jgi:hypothetical protein